MIKTGIDLVEINRMKKSLQNPRFLTRVFSEEEQQLFIQKGTACVQSIAANFAAKEAFSKAIGTGIRHFRLKDISLLRKENGEPYFVFGESVQQLMEQNGFSFSVSITHTSQYAAAVVIAYNQSENTEGLL